VGTGPGLGQRAQGGARRLGGRLLGRVELRCDSRLAAAPQRRWAASDLAVEHVVGLTRSEGADKGEPEKYYPSGKRTYGRIMPPDNVDAAAQVTHQKEQGCTKLYVLHDKEVYGQGVADLVAASAPKQGLKVLGNEGLDVKAANFRSIAAKIKASGADCMFYGATTANKTVQVWIDVNGTAPEMKLFGPAGMSDSAFTEKIPEAASARPI